MNLIVDANILFSILIKSGKTEELIFDSRFNLYAPEFVFEEFSKYKEVILNKTKRSEEDFYSLIEILKKRINLMSEKYYETFLIKAEQISPDINDVKYFAMALYLNCALWSNDKLLKNQEIVRVYSTTDLLNMFNLI